MKPLILQVNMAKNNVTTQEKVKISVFAFSCTDEPIVGRLPMTLGNREKEIKTR